MKQEYIEAIKKKIEECNDLALLDFIYRLIKKAEEKAA